jgi:hypothetical protein
MKLAIISASAGMDSMLRMALVNSPGACGSSCTASIAISHAARFDFLIKGGRFFVPVDARDQEGLAADIVEHRKSLLALGYQVMRAVRRGDKPHNRGGGANAM